MFLLGHRIIVTGGSIVGGVRCNAVEAYDPELKTWIQWAPLLTARDEHLTMTCHGKIYVVGGVPTGSTTALATVEVYDEKKNEWTTCRPMREGRGYAAGASVNGKIYVFGI